MNIHENEKYFALNIHENKKCLFLIPHENEKSCVIYSVKYENKYEIDFLTVKNKKICPIEVKSSSYTSHKSFDYFVKKYQLKMQDRYIIYTKDLIQKDNILYIPIYMTMLV